MSEVKKMLELEVSPEEGLQHDNWEFVLGMHFSHAVAIIQSQVRTIKSANVIFNDQSPLKHDLILDLNQDGLRLLFDSRTQRLKLIEIYSLKLVRLKYCGTVFNGPEVIPTIYQIDNCFGATRPGTFDKEKQLFALNFRGLSFYFPIDSKFEPHLSHHGLGSLRFPGEATPILTRIIVYHGNNPAETPVPPIPPSVVRGGVYVNECQVLRDETSTLTLGLKLKLFSHSMQLEEGLIEFEREVRFGDSAQCIAAKLGTPIKTFYKSDDKMKIHSKEAHKKVTSERSDFFFNYFTLGLDVLFDASTNRAIKFILHTNFPGHYDFTDYYRCPFILTLGRAERPGGGLYEISSPVTPPSVPSSSSGGECDSSSPTEKVISGLSSASISGPPLPSQGNKSGGNNRKKKNGKKNSQQGNPTTQNESKTQPSDMQLLGGTSAPSETKSFIQGPSSIVINWDTSWDKVRNFLCPDKSECPRLDKPVVLTRSSASNPFGPSLCYGLQDMIFEVMSNDHLASVTLYNFQQDDMPA